MSDITANVVISMPSQLFTLARSFKAVSNGKIYIGKIDTDPTIPSNQIQIYLENEDGSHVPVSQPIAINAGGFPVYNGQIAKFVTVQGHSMAVYDAYGVQQFYYPNVLKYDPDQLRTELASNGGASIVGTASGNNLQTELDSLNTAKNKINHLVFFDDYPGVVGDGVNDDTAGFNAATLDIAKRGGGTILGSFGKTYLIKGTVLFASNTQMDFRWATIKGFRSGSTLPTFETATLEGDLLVSNISAPDETKIVWNSTFNNVYVVDAYTFLRANDFLKGCWLKNIKFSNCRQGVDGRNMFYSVYEDIYASGGTEVSVPFFSFGKSSNAIEFKRVTTTVEWAYSFTDGGAALSWSNCTFEGGSRGFSFDGEYHGMKWDNNYFEAIRGTLFSFLHSTYINAEWISNYINFTDVIFQGSGSGIVRGIWHESNDIVNVGVEDNGFTYRGLVDLSNPGTVMEFHLPQVIDGSTTIPSNIISGSNSNVSLISHRSGVSVGDILSKNISTSGVIPLHFSGDTGRTYPNQVAFCTHQAFAPGNTDVTVLLDTKIVYRDTTFAKFNLILTSSTGDVKLYGDIYGVNVNRADPNSSMGIIIRNAGGFIRLEIGAFTSSGGIYTLTGTVQVCS
jgi:hypothetical protein